MGGGGGPVEVPFPAGKRGSENGLGGSLLVRVGLWGPSGVPQLSRG